VVLAHQLANLTKDDQRAESVGLNGPAKLRCYSAN
jgi:hypothetical protein